MKLFKVRVIDTYSTYRKIKPIYVVTENKAQALEYVQRHLRDRDHRAVSASYLGEQLATHMYSAN